ncbi:MAG: succinate dehydrogenase, hydrophobic membrane anchor protein [Woeseiaceae bacterium]
MSSLRSPLGRVLGSGSAKDGTDHWWSQRVSAVALVLLGVWFLISLTQLPGFAYDDVHDWIARPWNAILLLLLLLTLAFHSNLGVQVVVEDYVQQPFSRVALLVVSKFVHIVLAAAAVFAVFRTAFGFAA